MSYITVIDLSDWGRTKFTRHVLHLNRLQKNEVTKKINKIVLSSMGNQRMIELGYESIMSTDSILSHLTMSPNVVRHQT